MRRAAIVGWTLLASTAAIAALHVPATQTFLGLRCPFEQADAAVDRDLHRDLATARLAQGEAATARPAGALALGDATRADLIEAAAAAGLTCGEELQCAPADPADTRRWFAEVDAHDAVVALVRLEYVTDPASALARLDVARAAVERQVGAPSHVTTADLAAADLRQARVDFRRRDYFAQLSATNLRDDRYLVAETYRAIR